MDCALFENYVDELNSFLGSGEVASPVVIQFARVKTFRGLILSSLTNFNETESVTF